MTKAGGARDIDAGTDRVDPGRAGIRHDDAGGTENRQAADNAEPCIEGLRRERFAARNGKFDLGVGSAPSDCGNLSDGVGDHAARHWIDCRLAWRNWKSRERHRADALTGPKNNAAAGRAEPHSRTDERAVRHVGIVAGVLDHAGGRRLVIHAGHGEGKARSLAAGQRHRQRHLDRVGKFAGHERGKSRLRRRGGASAGGPTPAQGALLFRHPVFFSPVIATRHYEQTRLSLL